MRRLSSALHQLANVQAARAAIVFQKTAAAKTAVQTAYAAMELLAIAAAIRLQRVDRLQSLSVPLTRHVQAVAALRIKWSLRENGGR